MLIARMADTTTKQIGVGSNWRWIKLALDQIGVGSNWRRIQLRSAAALGLACTGASMPWGSPALWLAGNGGRRARQIGHSVGLPRKGQFEFRSRSDFGTDG